MNITRQQFETAEKGAPVEIVAENKKYILISRDVYEQLAHLQDQELDPEKTYGAVLEAWDSVGNPDDANDYL
jgi:hypothetical protein